jgi:hypothetical protein
MLRANVSLFGACACPSDGYMQIESARSAYEISDLRSSVRPRLSRVDCWPGSAAMKSFTPTARSCSFHESLASMKN